MQDLASFQKFSGGNIPRPSQREGATPFRTQHPARLLAGRGSQDPGVGTQTLVPSTFQPWLRPWAYLTVTYKSGKVPAIVV